MQLNTLRWFSQSDTFSDEIGFHDSRWHAWERRIQQGHAAEEDLINRIYDQRKEQLNSDPAYDPAEWAGEDYMETCRLTNSMYAALIVGIWSEMERFLKDVIVLCHRMLEKRRKAFQHVQEFCEDSLAGKTPKVTLDSCIQALKEVKAAVPYAFDSLKKALKKEVCIEIDKCDGFTTVDAVRILNNSFKHNRGRYKPKVGEPHTQIDNGLLANWSILNDRNDIEYSKLPLKELVVACNRFCNDLLDRLEAHFEQKFIVDPENWTADGGTM